MSADLSNGSSVDYHFGPYRFDGRLRRLYREGEPVTLTPKAADTLLALIERAGRVIEKDAALACRLGDTFVGDDTLAQNISTLRRALADDASQPRFIATIPRRGYRFVAPVRAASDVAAPSARTVTRLRPTTVTRLVALVGGTTADRRSCARLPLQDCR